MQTKSADHLLGYLDFWCGRAPSKKTPEYLRGHSAGLEAKRVLEEFGFSTDNKRHTELSGPA